MKRLSRLLAVLFLVGIFAGCAGTGGERMYETTFYDLFDTVSTVKAAAPDEAAFSALSKELHGRLEEYHRLYDIYNEYDGLTNLKVINDTAAFAPVKADQRIIELLSWGKELYALSGGKVNIAMGSVLALWHDCRQKALADPETAAVPDEALLREAAVHTNIEDLVIDEEAGTVYFSDPALRLDVGAIGKGFAVEAVCRWLEEEKGVSSALVNVGGNVRAIGSKGSGSWKIGIENPDGGEYLALIGAEDLAVVTSGDYQRFFTAEGKRWHHLIDPETLFPAEYLRSVTVAAPDSGLADGLSTALFLLPPKEGLALIESVPEAEAAFVLKDGSLLYSSGFEALLAD